MGSLGKEFEPVLDKPDGSTGQILGSLALHLPESKPARPRPIDDDASALGILVKLGFANLVEQAEFAKLIKDSPELPLQ